MNSVTEFIQNGVQAHERGNINEAIYAYQSAIDMDQKNATAHNNIGFAYGQIKEWQKARFHLEEAIRLNESMANAHANLGQILAAQGKAERGISALRKATELESDNAQHWNNLARVYFSVEDFQQAEYAWHRALGIEPGDNAIRTSLATAIVAQQRFSEAHRLFDQVIECQPDFQAAWAQKGLALFLENDFGSARKCLQVALQLNANDYTALRHLALLSIASKDNSAAYHYMQQLCECFPQEQGLQVDLAVLELGLDKKVEACQRLAKANEWLNDSRTLYYYAVSLKETGGDYAHIEKLLQQVQERQDEYLQRATKSLESLTLN